jgi:flagellar hook assembly protein FlgD
MPFKILVGSKAFVERELSKLMPETFELAQNFPNPFNPSTSISIKLPRESQVRLEIFNLLGQRIRTLADGRYAQGIYTFVWNGVDQSGQFASSGVYFYRLMDGENLIQSKKMIFAK